jgi:ribosomal protein S18 acetylase RimI-like enzyme
MPDASTNPGWRAMVPGDLAFVQRLAEALYPDHPESHAAFEAKLTAAPDACRIAERDGQPAGYCIALRATRGCPPRLDQAAYAAVGPHTLHLHDVALDPVARGAGLVGGLLTHLAAVAGDLPLSLIAVNGTHGLWRRHGFVDAPVDESVRATYGKEAVYMIRGR